jgi:hypothetical protein
MRNHTAQIIQLFAPRQKRRGEDKTTRASSFPTKPKCKEGASDTAENFRLRQDRYYDWRQAASIMDYWRAMMKIKSAIACVQNYGTPEGDMHEFVTDETHGHLVAKWRAAWARLMLTPAPNAREVNWKRAQLKADKYKCTGLSAARIEQAIADDVEFLKAHPTRRSRGAIEERREWKAAFRARVTLYAEQNGIDKSELAWLGRLRHQDLVSFARRHRVDYAWMFTGERSKP